MILYSQRDPAWAKETIGMTPYTIGQVGCTVTCLAMLASYFFSLKGQQKTYTPRYLAKVLKFTPDARYYWKSGDGILPFNFVWRHHQRDDDTIRDALEDPNKAVMLEVKFGIGRHWLVATDEYTTFIRKKAFKIADPLKGNRGSAGDTFSRYPTITGMTTFETA